jgi:hypothetical protein
MATKLAVTAADVGGFGALEAAASKTELISSANKKAEAVPEHEGSPRARAD